MTLHTDFSPQSEPQQNKAKPEIVHPLWLRLCHWLNALAILIMVTSGWQIYNASPLFDFEFSRSLTLGGWLGVHLVMVALVPKTLLAMLRGR